RERGERAAGGSVRPTRRGDVRPVRHGQPALAGVGGGPAPLRRGAQDARRAAPAELPRVSTDRRTVRPVACARGGEEAGGAARGEDGGRADAAPALPDPAGRADAATGAGRPHARAATRDPEPAPAAVGRGAGAPGPLRVGGLRPRDGRGLRPGRGADRAGRGGPGALRVARPALPRRLGGAEAEGSRPEGRGTEEGANGECGATGAHVATGSPKPNLM